MQIHPADTRPSIHFIGPRRDFIHNPKAPRPGRDARGFLGHSPANASKVRPRYAGRVDPARLQRILRQHVETDRLLGVDAVPRAAAPAAHPKPAAASPDPVAEAPAESLLAPVDAVGQTYPDALPRAERIELLRVIDQSEVQGCTRCELCHGRTNTVFGEGDPEAPVMFIGEGPGQTEDETGRPFVGRAGELLTKMIGAMGFEREQIYIANVVKCRPPGNRTPTPVEVQTCWDYLRRQIEIIRPAAIVTVGGPASKMLLSTDTGITRLRGTWHRYDAVDPPIPVMPTFHPAYLLRSYTRENRQKVWSDLQQVMEHLNQN